MDLQWCEVHQLSHHTKDRFRFAGGAYSFSPNEHTFQYGPNHVNIPSHCFKGGVYVFDITFGWGKLQGKSLYLALTCERAVIELHFLKRQCPKACKTNKA